MESHEEGFSPEKNEQTRYWECEKKLHKEVIPPGSIFDIVWEEQQKQGIKGDLIIPEASCPSCVKSQ